MGCIKNIFRILYREIPFFVIFSFLISFPIAYTLWYKFNQYDMVWVLFSSEGLLSRYCLGGCITVFLMIILGNYFSKAKYVLYFIALSYFAVVFFLINVFSMELSPLVFNMIMETNKDEASGFFSTFFITKGAVKTYVYILGVIAIIYITEKKKDMFCMMRYNNRITSICMVLIAIFLFNGLRAIKAHVALFRCDTLQEINSWERTYGPIALYDALDVVFFSTYYEIVLRNQMRVSIYNTKNVEGVAGTNENVNVVFVLGESFIKWHSSLYGYYRNTNPFLTKEKDKGNLFLFSDVITPFNNTMETERNIFSCNSMLDDEQWPDAPIFQAVFKKAGFNVYMWDILRNPDSRDLGDISTNTLLYSRDILGIYDGLNSKSFSYDGQLIDDFKKMNIEKNNKSNLVIFHLTGQHVPFSDRYPHIKEFSKFTNSDPSAKLSLTAEMKKAINDYDNATLYNDWILKQIIEEFEDYNTVLIYFSDHGEEVYDYRNSMGRTISPPEGLTDEWLKYEFEIPFMIWCSDTYIHNQKDVIERIKVSQDKPFMTDVVYQLLFHVAGIKTLLYNSRRDVINDNYQVRDRILGNRMNYDRIRKK